MRVVVLDIEGTICSISFVKDVLFPYALKRADELISNLDKGIFPIQSWSKDNDELIKYLSAFPEEYKASRQKLIDHINDLTAQDIKMSYLKNLQGYLWKSGYDSGEIEAPIYEDAVNKMQKWSEDDSIEKIVIYSSGSVNAQKLLFKHCQGGLDLTKYIDYYFDTINAGFKTEAESYKKIAKEIGIEGSEIMFFSDNYKEIVAAIEAGWNATIVVRPGNPPLPEYVVPDEVEEEYNEEEEDEEEDNDDDDEKDENEEEEEDSDEEKVAERIDNKHKLVEGFEEPAKKTKVEQAKHKIIHNFDELSY